MAKVVLMCGKLCSGKSTHARLIREKEKAVILSVDEITLSLFGQDAGDKLDDYVSRLKDYLYDKSVEIFQTGISVVLDWGFWTREERAFARAYYHARGIACELHYIEISDAEWENRIEKRNRDILEKKTGAYYVDDGLKQKFASVFEPPAPEEVDVYIRG